MIAHEIAGDSHEVHPAGRHGPDRCPPSLAQTSGTAADRPTQRGTAAGRRRPRRPIGRPRRRHPRRRRQSRQQAPRRSPPQPTPRPRRQRDHARARVEPSAPIPAGGYAAATAGSCGGTPHRRDRSRSSPRRRPTRPIPAPAPHAQVSGLQEGPVRPLQAARRPAKSRAVAALPAWRLPPRTLTSRKGAPSSSRSAFSMTIRFDDRVAIVTGAGGGLGRALCARTRAARRKVVVNDLGGARDGTGHSRRRAEGGRGDRGRRRRGDVERRQRHRIRPDGRDGRPGQGGLGRRPHPDQQCRRAARQELRQDGAGGFRVRRRRPPDRLGQLPPRRCGRRCASRITAAS